MSFSTISNVVTATSCVVFFMQVARRLKLRFSPEFSNCCGGEAIEKAAAKGNPEAVNIPIPMLQYRDCNFSFAGLKQSARTHITRQEEKYGKFANIFQSIVSY